jgi:hypothetical protein
VGLPGSIALYTFGEVFNETGLPTGTPWSVGAENAAGAWTNGSSSTPFIELALANGTYTEHPSQVPGFAVAMGIRFTVSGTIGDLSVRYALNQWPYAFEESGLSAGTAWSVNVNGTVQQSSTTASEFSLHNGTYPVSVLPVQGYRVLAAPATVTVRGPGGQSRVEFEANASNGTNASILLGGSPAVCPYSELASRWFEQNNSAVTIGNDQGGTQAAMVAACQAAIDIGVAAASENVSQLETTDGCPFTVVITHVAYDALDVMLDAGTPHGLYSVSADTLTTIFDHATGDASNVTLLAPSIDGVAVSSGPLDVPPFALVNRTTPLPWGQIPACVLGAANCGGSGIMEALTGSVGGAGGSCAQDPADVCESGSRSPCGFTVCAGPFNNSWAENLIRTVAVAPARGITGLFEARLLGATSASTFASSVRGLGFDGCGTQEQLSDCGMTPTVVASSAAGAISEVAADPDAIGYAPHLEVLRSGSGVEPVSFLAVGQSEGNVCGQYSNGGIIPTTGQFGTISAGIQNGSTVAPYVGWAPFEWVTANTPRGEVQYFMQFVLDPANNQALCSALELISLYSI